MPIVTDGDRIYASWDTTPEEITKEKAKQNHELDTHKQNLNHPEEDQRKVAAVRAVTRIPKYIEELDRLTEIFT